MENLFTKLTLNIPGVMSIGPEKFIIDENRLTRFLEVIVKTEVGELENFAGLAGSDMYGRSMRFLPCKEKNHWNFILEDKNGGIKETYQFTSAQLIDAIWEHFGKFNLPYPNEISKVEHIDEGEYLFILNKDTGTALHIKKSSFGYLGTAKPVNGKMGEPGVKYDFMRSPYFC